MRKERLCGIAINFGKFARTVALVWLDLCAFQNHRIKRSRLRYNGIIRPEVEWQFIRLKTFSRSATCRRVAANLADLRSFLSVNCCDGNTKEYCERGYDEYFVHIYLTSNISTAA